MSIKTSKKREFDHFSSIAKEWWLPNGKFKILHELTPLRIDYILKQINKGNINKLDILDLGCGGGLTCEPLARLNANVTGIDFVPENIMVAKKHAKISDLKINYICDDLDNFKVNNKYDVVLLLEVIEHMENWEKMIEKIKSMLKPNGHLIISTINRNILSKILAIYFAENILKWIPKNTHNYEKLITPKELNKILLKNNFKLINTSGLNFNFLTKEWKLSKNNYLINYFCTAKIN